MERYDRQRRVGERGREVDDRFARLRALLVGVGGIGAPLAMGLVRAGIGTLTIIDPDTVAESDLSRQVLFRTEDVGDALLKVEAAERELARIGGRSAFRASGVALTPGNADVWVRDADVVLDATDHLAARLWIDAACRRVGRPWIHTAAIADRYVVIPFLRPGPPCFRCYLPELPPAGAVGSCESLGVLPVATALAADHAIAALWGWLAARDEKSSGTRMILRGRVGEPAPRASVLRADPSCPSCGTEPSGSERAPPALRLLCGRKRVEGWVRAGIGEVRARLDASPGEWEVVVAPAGLRARRGDESLSLTADGRLIYGPAEDLEVARSRLSAILGPCGSFAEE